MRVIKSSIIDFLLTETYFFYSFLDISFFRFEKQIFYIYNSLNDGVNLFEYNWARLYETKGYKKTAVQERYFKRTYINGNKTNLTLSGIGMLLGLGFVKLNGDGSVKKKRLKVKPRAFFYNQYIYEMQAQQLLLQHVLNVACIKLHILKCRLTITV